MSIAFEDTRAIIANHMLADGMSPIIDLKKSHGSWLRWTFWEKIFRSFFNVCIHVGWVQSSLCYFSKRAHILMSL